MAETKIEWTDKTWNPIVGCTKCSVGCKNCYAEKMAWRLACMGKPYYDMVTFDGGGWNGNIECIASALDKPLHWRKPCKIFVCSMSDLFHPKVPFEFIDKVFDNAIIAEHRYSHIFQILTKRIKRMAEYLAINKGLPKIPNFHFGVSISTQKEADEKIPILLQIPAAIRFVSIEPMLEEIDLRTHLLGKCGYYCDDRVGHVDHIDLDWVIVGAESGPKRRECKYEWVDSIVAQCEAANVPCFVKQINNQQGKLVKMPSEYPQDYPKEIAE